MVSIKHKCQYCLREHLLAEAIKSFLFLLLASTVLRLAVSILLMSKDSFSLFTDCPYCNRSSSYDSLASGNAFHTPMFFHAWTLRNKLRRF
ncbi:hypothetical protein V8C35DRAFT_290655 [Trichoderma chlorosporum]